MHDTLITQSFILSIFTCFCVMVLCTDPEKCYLSSKTQNIEQEKLLNRISPLFGQTLGTGKVNKPILFSFRTEKDGNSYTVSICSDTSKSRGNVSATKTSAKGDILVLGRRNETYFDGGDTWVLLKYECGDKKSNYSDSQCLGYSSASIYILCDPIEHDEFANIKLAEIEGTHYTFILPSIIICKHEEGVSGSTVFFIVLCVALFMYFIVGIVYRRLVHNAQGCQQLPHFPFWQKLGAFLANGCNYFCMCDTEPESSWNNITSNFDSGDRDDALLRT